MRESTIERHAVRRAKALGGEIRKVQWIGRRGAPDRLLMLPARTLAPYSIDCAHCNPRGQAIWIEFKAPGEKPEPHQRREHERMRAMGQRVEVVDSVEAFERLVAV